jgi:hypothetical protein
MKSILIVRASQNVNNDAILELSSRAKHYNIEASYIEATSINDLEFQLSGKKYDYIYFAGHGNGTCFGDPKSLISNWRKIGTTICSTDCLNENAIMMMYCCKGVLNTVAFKLMAASPSVEYVCGAKQNMKNIDLIIGYNVFLCNVENRNIDPVLSARKSTLAKEIRFECFDRTEVESNPLYYYNYCPDSSK